MKRIGSLGSIIILVLIIIIKPFDVCAQALDFDGSDDYVSMNSVATAMASQNNFTVECWVKIDSIYQTTQGGIFAVHTSTRGNLFILFAGGNGNSNLLTVYDGTSGAYEIVSIEEVANHNWHHVAYVRNGPTGELFLDGSSQGTHTANYTFSSTDLWSLGQEWDGGGTSDHLNGIIDEVRIWKTSRTQLQIQQNMNKEICVYPSSLVAYYKLNQGIPWGINFDEDTIYDQTNHNFLAIPENFALAGLKSNWSEGLGFSIGSSRIDTACKEFVSPSGKHTWTQSGNYNDTLLNKDMCDSIVTIDLTINKVYTDVSRMGPQLTVVVAADVYQWLDCDDNYKPISGATSRSFTPTKNGNYAVWIVDKNCSDTSNCYGVGLGLSNESFKNEVKIYPNPTSGTLNLELGRDFELISISLQNSIGQVVLYNEFMNRNKIMIDLNILSKGIYLLSVQTQFENAHFNVVKD